MTQGWLRTETPPSLLHTECHIWLWSLSDKDCVEESMETLSAEELAAAHRFIFREDFCRYVRCHLSMRRILASYLRCLPRDIRFIISASGKPLLDGHTGNLHFSLSHTTFHAILAVAYSPIGADIEEVRSIDGAVAEVNFSASEQKQLDSYIGEEWGRCFFRCWTRKEALLKAEGLGLTVDLQAFDVEIAHDKFPALLRHEREVGFSCDWQLRDISPSADVIAAVAVTPEVQGLRLLRLSPE